MIILIFPLFFKVRYVLLWGWNEQSSQSQFSTSTVGIHTFDKINPIEILFFNRKTNKCKAVGNEGLGGLSPQDFEKLLNFSYSTLFWEEQPTPQPELSLDSKRKFKFSLFLKFYLI